MPEPTHLPASGDHDAAQSKPDHPLPEFYDDLAATLQHSWRMLIRGAHDRRSPLHTPAVATTGRDGAPQVRTVVLRAVDQAARTFRFHTDRRSGKTAELAADPRLALLGYDPGHKIQLRIAGRATCHAGDAVAAECWARSQTMSRACYSQAVPPGCRLENGGGAADGITEGYANFVAVVVAIDAIEWLYLAHAGHRRARFTWSPAGLESSWLAP